MLSVSEKIRNPSDPVPVGRDAPSPGRSVLLRDAGIPSRSGEPEMGNTK